MRESTRFDELPIEIQNRLISMRYQVRKAQNQIRESRARTNQEIHQLLSLHKQDLSIANGLLHDVERELTHYMTIEGSEPLYDGLDIDPERDIEKLIPPGE